MYNYVERILYVSHQQNHFYGVSLFSPSGPTPIVHNSSQHLALMQLISKINNLTQTRFSEFSDPNEEY